MTRDALIEALASSRFRGDYEDGVSWSALCQEDKDRYRKLVRTHDLPVIVAFVAEWLTSHAARISDHNPEALSTADWITTSWHKDMA